MLTGKVNVYWKAGDYECQMEFLVLDTDRFEVLLGMDWLKRNNPHIDWKNQSMKLSNRGQHFELDMKGSGMNQNNNRFIDCCDVSDEDEISVLWVTIKDDEKVVREAD